ncbi:hypothetical protein [Eubacterium ramulus]|uniref:hypothetical protein n=1 Tax=Eubacterium ramulus TaxID=39490 RepID=UPI0022E5B832|nr:hypothetical protein [Eubacterium ramulus]
MTDQFQDILDNEQIRHMESYFNSLIGGAAENISAPRLSRTLRISLQKAHLTLSKCEKIGLLRKEYIIRCPECSLVIKRAGYIKDLPLGPYECYGCSKKVLITLDEVEPVYTKKEETK